MSTSVLIEPVLGYLVGGVTVLHKATRESTVEGHDALPSRHAHLGA